MPSRWRRPGVRRGAALDAHCCALLHTGLLDKYWTDPSAQPCRLCRKSLNLKWRAGRDKDANIYVIEIQT
jgi:hypothetical protein